MEHFSDMETAEDLIVIAYGLEDGLREFYLAMETKSSDEDARAVFFKLAELESSHQKRLLELYTEITGKKVTQEDFSQSIVSPALEGGMTTEEYLERFHTDLNSMTDILSLAMGIEAQALDLYQRASTKAENQKASEALLQIASEERIHLQSLADFMDKQLS